MAGSKWLDQVSGGGSMMEGDCVGGVERETGIVEKLLNTYGFIRCCDRQARLFFHYSQFGGNLEHLKVGDAVDFEMTFDKKSGKPIAVSVSKISNDPTLGMGQQLVTGMVTSELNAEGREGRVAYENCGECFFFEFSRDDLVDGLMAEVPRQGQSVQFVITQDSAGNLQAGQVRVATAVAGGAVMQVGPQGNGGGGGAQLGPQLVTQATSFLTGPMVGVYPGAVVVPVGAIAPTLMAAPLAHHPHQIGHVVAGYAPHNGAQVPVIHLMNGGPQVPPVNGRMITGGNGGPLNGNHVREVQQQQADSIPQQMMKMVQQQSLNSQSNNAAASTQQHFNSGQATKQPHHSQAAAGGAGIQQQAKQQTTSQQAPSPQQTNKTAGGTQAKQTNNNKKSRSADDELAPNAGRFQGVVCTLKDTYGFVERADVVREIFFHCTEGYQNIALGDDVSFNISMRNNREVAVVLQRLNPGTVVFDDIDECVRRGTVTQLANQTDEPLDGRVTFEAEGGASKDVIFGDRDLAPLAWTMRVGDPVTFQLATDRRDGLERATNIQLDAQSSAAFAKETRLTGNVVALKENFGFVSTNGSEQGEYYFKLSEVLDPEIRIDSAVQFSLANDSQSTATDRSSSQGNNPRQVAIRVCRVSTGQAAAAAQTAGKKKAGRKSGAAGKDVKYTNRGYVVALKEHFGFIEAESRQDDLFFHYSTFEGDVKDLSIGSEVEYTLATKNQRQSAESVRAIDRGTVTGIELLSKEVHAGKIVRSLRCFNPEQEPYCGLIQVKSPPEDIREDAAENGEAKDSSKDEPQEYEFSVMSLSKKGEVMHKGDAVTFQLAMCKATQQVMAVSVRAARERKTALVEAVKGQYGFLNFELNAAAAAAAGSSAATENGGSAAKKLSFHLSEVKGGVTIQAGDVVEFDLVRGGRQNRLTALNVTRTKEKEASPRPASLVNRLKAMTVSKDDGPRVTVIRQPRGPDGSRGFTQQPPTVAAVA